MKKTTKGALAAGAAAAILLGGAGTLAYWTADTNVNAGTLSSGTITLGTPACGSGWTHTETSTPVVKVIPGDTIRLQCTVTLDLQGDHIGAKLQIGNITAAGPLASELTFGAVTLSGDGVTNNTVVGQGTKTITATVNASYPYGTVSANPLTSADNDGKNITAEQLGQLQLVAVQTHN
ncbi:alternate-type signal peptide domain-containing protein [Aeromicrobium sp. Leaf350]|uniref:alternate-type signal peptide domain-containing protein n=1 Tax=Aeromicrobium sp. Leaf350 TaxID=2876565 RepID=UPI001E468F60|nr:alternate-type signal peptide domain-containing protein [Aeromicrobium sp. Leaf350]